MKNQSWAVIFSTAAVMVTSISLMPPKMANASTNVRATELTSKVWNNLNDGLIQDLTIEFRQGDRLPITLQFQGDFIETSEFRPSYIIIKRPFWVKIEVNHNRILMSLDGTDFKPIQQIINGKFTAGATADQPEGGIANAINLLFSASLK